MKSKQGNRWVTRWRLFTPLVAVLTLAVIFGLPGCSDKPLDVNTSQEEITFFDQTFDPLDKKTSYSDWNTTFGTIDVADGGILEVPGGHSTFAFEVEALSFPADTVFQVTVYIVDNDAEVPTIIYEFGPEGLEFTSPATLILEADYVAGPDGQYINFYYLNGKKWELQGKYYRDGHGKINVPVYHFSRYGSDGPKGP